MADSIAPDAKLLESREMRMSHLDRDDVLDKVGALALAGDSGYALTEHVAAFFGASREAIDQLVKRNRDELVESGYRTLKGDELRKFKVSVTSDTNLYAPQIAVFSRRTVLNLAMLMDGNDVAKAIRTYLLNVEELADAELKKTALERARERVDFKHFRDIMAAEAVDYKASSPASAMAFARLQNLLYRAVLGKTAQEIKASGREIQHWTGKRGPTKDDRDVAKNYLTAEELKKVGKRVAILCLEAEIASEDGRTLTMGQWLQLVETSLGRLDPPLLTA